MKHKTTIGIVAALILLVVSIPYIKEYKIYSKAKNGHEIYLCDEYLYEYPDGRYAEEVREMKDDLTFVSAKTYHEFDWYVQEFPKGKHLEEVRYMKIDYSKDEPSQLLRAINEYLSDFPDGRYSGAVNATCDSLWDVEIARYNSREKKQESAAAVTFMSEMLQYMKKNRINSVLIDVTSHLKLKDYEEYDRNARVLLEAMNNNQQLSLSAGMISLKSNFSEADVSSLMRILSDGVQKSLDKMFSPGFISVESSSPKALPKLHFDYTIRNQEDPFGDTTIPHIWSYNDGIVVKNYLLGISISFNAHFSLPGSSTTFDYSEKGEPANNINYVANIRDGYKRMTSMCFTQFSNKMARNMGLKESYSRAGTIIENEE